VSERPANLLLADMREAADRIARYTASLDLQGFVKDEKTADAVVRNLEIIGEAANRLPEAVRASAPEVDWRGIVGLRNRVVHVYFGVDLQMVWEIARNDLPAFRTALTRLGAQPPGGDSKQRTHTGT
jgi:uncharacterized protein with HEPN domain